jgi:hypothetical protein
MFFAVMAAPLYYIRPELFDEAVDRHHCSQRSAQRDTLSVDPHVAADTPAVDSEVRNSYLLFIHVSLQ